MKILIPVLTGEEDEDEFLEEVKKEEPDKVILLNIVKREEVEDVPAGYAGTKIKESEEIMEKIKKQLPSKIEVEENIEWGDVKKKIKVIAKIKNIDKVILNKTEHSKEIEEELKDLDINIRIIN